MGHKRHKVRGDFSNINPGRGGPGITESGYPPHLVVSIEHPELNPEGVTVETFTEEVSEEQIFGANVGEVLEDFINQNNNNPNKEGTTMNTNNNAKETNNTNSKETETMNNTNSNVKQENANMNNEQAKVNQDGTIDDGSNTTVNPQKPSLAKEAASAFVVGAAYGAGTVCAVIGISLLVSGIRKLACGDTTTAGDAATAAETTETVAEAFLR